MVNICYPKKLHDLPFLLEKKIKTVEKLVTNLHDKEEYLIHISNLKEALSHGLVLKKGQKNNKFNHEAWLKQYIDMKTGLRTNTKNDWNDFFKLMNDMSFVEV